jgi:hypothetical protein
MSISIEIAFARGALQRNSHIEREQRGRSRATK